MRISDWSSDVCSSDLDLGRGRGRYPFATDEEFIGMLDAFDTGHPNSPYISKLKAIDPKPLSPTSLIDTLVDSATMHIPHGMFRYRGLEWALLQTLTRFPRLGSCTVKVSCDERFQRKIGRASCRERVCHYG